MKEHECAYFEISNDKNNDIDKYALIYGGCQKHACYHIYEFKNETWNKNAIKCNGTWFRNHRISLGFESKYGFGGGLSMITDLFEKNKIYIVGGT